jgi:hypothetical protein
MYIVQVPCSLKEDSVPRFSASGGGRGTPGKERSHKQLLLLYFLYLLSLIKQQSLMYNYHEGNTEEETNGYVVFK